MDLSSVSGQAPPTVDRGPAILVVHWTLFAIAFVVVCLRFYVRTFMRSAVGWDDWTILAALVLALLEGIFETIDVQHGMGKHWYYVQQDPTNVATVMRMTLYVGVVNTLGTTLVKVSVCIFTLRLTEKVGRSVRLLIWGNLSILIPMTISCVTVLCVQCVPISAYWDPIGHPDAKCISGEIVTNVIKAYSAVGVVTDFMTVALPISVIWKLQMSLKLKYGLCGLMALGFFAASCSIAKTVVVDWGNSDISWDDVQVSIWAAFEHEMGIIVATVPTLTPILKKLAAKKIQWRPSSGIIYDHGKHNSTIELGDDSYQHRTPSEDGVALTHSGPMEITKTTNVTVEKERVTAEMTANSQFRYHGRGVDKYMGTLK